MVNTQYSSLNIEKGIFVDCVKLTISFFSNFLFLEQCQIASIKMYLKEVYKHSKLLFIAITCGFVFQLINNARQDVAFSPVYAYGMYSEAILPQKEYIVPEIVVNDRRLQTKDFTSQQWDKIILPVVLYSKQQRWNRYIFDNYVHRLLHISDSSFYVNNFSQTQFSKWYMQYLETILHNHVSTLSINFSEYNLTGNVPVKVQSAQILPGQ
jgi:hypothetical protein